MVKFCFFLILPLTVTSCVTHESAPVTGPASTSDRIGKAIVSPLNDLNLIQTAIPPVIQEALKDPYQIPAISTCDALAEQIHLLDMALGADLDAMVATEQVTYLDQGGTMVQDEAVGSVERTIQGAIPFRSWIRKFSGAEKHSKELTTAIAAGIVRRAFLKGIGLEHGCEPPAAPLKHSIEHPVIVAPAVSPPLIPQPLNPASPTASQRIDKE